MEIYQPEQEENTEEPKKPRTNAETVNMLMKRAYEGKHSQFNYLRSFEEQQVVIEYRRQSESIAKSFIKAKKNLLKEYIRYAKLGQDIVELLVSYKSVDKIIDYYKYEAAVAKDCLDEYMAYIAHGHLLSTAAGEYRSDEDLWDHRYDKPTD